MALGVELGLARLGLAWLVVQGLVPKLVLNLVLRLVPGSLLLGTDTWLSAEPGSEFGTRLVAGFVTGIGTDRGVCVGAGLYTWFGAWCRTCFGSLLGAGVGPWLGIGIIVLGLVRVLALGLVRVLEIVLVLD